MIKHINAKNEVNPVVNYKDLCIEEKLEYGDKKLSFTIPFLYAQGLNLEDYLRTETDEYVIKQNNKISTDGAAKIVAQLNIEELEGNVFENFESVGQTIKNAMDLALVGTGWTCVCDLTKRRTLRLTNSSVWKIIKQAVDTYSVDIKLDTLNKVVTFVDRLGSDKGAYFTNELNLKSLEQQGNTNEFYTRILPIGKNGLTIEGVNGGSRYIVNNTYSSKVKTYIWRDERYTDAESLMEDATLKLEEMACPYNSYSCNLIDLSKLSKQYDFLAFEIGDTITLVDKITKTRIKQRIAKICSYPDDHSKDTCEISNPKLSFDKYVQRIRQTSETVDNITNDNGTVNGDAIDSIDATKVLNLDEVIAASGKFNELSVGIVNVSEELTAVKGRVGALESNEVFATYAQFKSTVTEDLKSINADIDNLETNALTADSAEIKDLITRINRTDTLIFGSASGNTIQTEFSNSVIAQLGNAQIKSAMIDEIDAAKITGLDINTSKLTVHSSDGKSKWADNTIVISDGTRTRVQIGKDASADYNMYVWNKSGNLMFDALGLTAEGITRQIIRDDVIMDNADISASKINIESLFNVINTDGSHTLKSSKIYVDAEAQTLDIAFTNMTTSVSAVTSTATTALSTANSAVTKVDNLEIGGRNLVKNSATRTFASTANGGAFTRKLVDDAEALSGKHEEITCTTAGSGFFSKPYTCETGITYTYSFWAKCSAEKSSNLFGFENGGRMSIKLTTEWQYYTHTFTATNQNSYNAFICYPNFAVGEVFYIRDFKLEYGSKATTWTPAPEDTDSAITAVDDRVTTVMQNVTTQGTQISTLQGQITSKVWQQDITSAVDNISVGNRNLIAGTATPVTITATSDYTFISRDFTIGELTAGESYAVSFDAEVLAGTVDKVSVAVYNDGWTVIYAKINKSIVDGKVTGIITPSGAATKLLIYAGEAGATSGKSIKVSNLMFCKGNKVPTDWSPAPEDTTSAITSLSTQYSELNQELNSISATVTSHTTQIASNSSNVASVQSTVSSLTLDLDGFKTTVSDTYTTKSDFEALAIGGRNLVTGSVSGKGWSYSTLSDGVFTKDNYTTSENYIYSSSFKLEANTTYTLSWEEKATANHVGTYNQVYIYNSTYLTTGFITYKTITTSVDWQKHIFTFKTGNQTDLNNTLIRFDNDGTNDGNVATIYVRRVKLEKGNRATDFTEAPEDTETQITTVKTEYTQLSGKFNWLVASGTSATDFTITDRLADLTAQYINLNGLVTFSALDSTAQSKINTASSNATNAISIANNATTTANTALTRANNAVLNAIDAVLGAGEEFSEDDDLNDYTGAGTYSSEDTSVVQSLQNAPSEISSAGEARLVVEYVGSSSYLKQTLTMTMAGSRNYYTYYRTGTSSGTWSVWESSDMVLANLCYDSNKTYINGGKIYTGTVTADKISTASLSAISANLGVVTAGIIKSSNYVSGASGMMLSLNDGAWDSKHFKLDNVGNATILGGSININDNLIIDSSGNLVSRGLADFQCDTVYANDFHSRGSLYIENSADIMGTFGVHGDATFQNDIYVKEQFYYMVNGGWMKLRDYINGLIAGTI